LSPAKKLRQRLASSSPKKHKNIKSPLPKNPPPNQRATVSVLISTPTQKKRGPTPLENPNNKKAKTTKSPNIITALKSVPDAKRMLGTVVEKKRMQALFQDFEDVEKAFEVDPKNTKLNDIVHNKRREFVDNLFVLKQREGKTFWHGWAEYFWIIELTNYAKDYFAKSKHCKEVTALTKVLKWDNPVVCMLCWKVKQGQQAIFSTSTNYNTSNFSNPFKKHPQNSTTN
jgi:hypothetical protein